MSRNPANKPDDRPFAPEILEKSRELAAKYRIILEPEGDCGYVGSSLEMPFAFGDGKSADECVKSVRESAAVAIAYLIEQGKTPPVPADQQQRTKQINIRLTEAEQNRLREAARARGFMELSEFVRTASLQSF